MEKNIEKKLWIVVGLIVALVISSVAAFGQLNPTVQSTTYVELPSFPSLKPGRIFRYQDSLWFDNGLTFINLSRPGTGGGGSMVYPGAGIALSTGSGWTTSITNNSSNWNTAYGWGNHALAGYLTTETDPTIYSWAKAATKPAYTYSEVGAEPAISKSTGFAKWTGSAWSWDNSTYLTGNQSITVNGVVSATGSTTLTTSFPSGKVAADSSLLTNIRVIGTAKVNLTHQASPTRVVVVDNTDLKTLKYETTTEINLGNSYNIESVGTNYTLTNAVALLDFSTTDPIITISESGTYEIIPQVFFLTSGATFASSQQIFCDVYRTNNTPQAVGQAGYKQADIMTTTTRDLGMIPFLPFSYIATAGDILELRGYVNTAPSAGSLQCYYAGLRARRIK